jgi:hypothetical protein
LETGPQKEAAGGDPAAKAAMVSRRERTQRLNGTRTTFVVAAVLNAIATQYLDGSGQELEKSELVNFSRQSILARQAMILVSSAHCTHAMNCFCFSSEASSGSSI